MTSGPPPTAPSTLLAGALQRSAARPLVTYYDLDRDARVELSVATYAVWVAKTAWWLSDDLDLEPGDRVSVVLPAHWVSLVWPMGVWAVGGTVVLAADRGAVVSVRAADDRETPSSGHHVVVSTRPLGGSAGSAAPVGSWDYGRDVVSQPDVLGPGHEASPTGPHDPLVSLLAAARQRAAATAPLSRRLLLRADALTAAVLRDALLVPLLTDGSCVLVTGDVDDQRLSGLAATENAVVLPDVDTWEPGPELTMDRW